MSIQASGSYQVHPPSIKALKGHCCELSDAEACPQILACRTSASDYTSR